MSSRTFASTLVLSLLAGCASAPRADPRATSGPLATVEAAARAEAAVDTVWPGFRPVERGFIVFGPGDGAWLVTDDVPPAPWSPVPSAERRLRGRLYHLAGDLPGIGGGVDVNYRVGERRYTAVRHDDDLRAGLTTLFHESFHQWQFEVFADFAVEQAPAEATRPEQFAGAELERRILAAALTARGASSDSLIAAFSAAREARIAGLSALQRTVERDLERKEGVAHLVGVQAAAAATGTLREQVIAELAAFVGRDLAAGGAPHAAQYRARMYGSGAAIAALLDRLGVSWREAVAAGAPLDSLLYAASPVRPGAALLAEMQRRFGYDELLARAVASAAPASDDPVADFVARSPQRLVVEVNATPGQDLGMTFDAGTAGLSSPVPSVFLIEQVATAGMSTPGFDLEISDRPVMLDGSASPRVRFVVLLPEPARIEGAPADVVGPVAGVVAVHGAGTELTVRGDHLVSITTDDGVVTVVVRPQ